MRDGDTGARDGAHGSLPVARVPPNCSGVLHDTQVLVENMLPVVGAFGFFQAHALALGLFFIYISSCFHQRVYEGEGEGILVLPIFPFFFP